MRTAIWIQEVQDYTEIQIILINNRDGTLMLNKINYCLQFINVTGASNQCKIINKKSRSLLLLAIPRSSYFNMIVKIFCLWKTTHHVRSWKLVLLLDKYVLVLSLHFQLQFFPLILLQNIKDEDKVWKPYEIYILQILIRYACRTSTFISWWTSSSTGIIKKKKEKKGVLNKITRSTEYKKLGGSLSCQRLTPIYISLIINQLQKEWQ